MEDRDPLLYREGTVSVNHLHDDDDEKQRSCSFCRAKLSKRMCGGRGLPKWAVLFLMPLILLGLGVGAAFLFTPMIVQDIINGSSITFDSISMVKARETSFSLSAVSKISRTGFLPATIKPAKANSNSDNGNGLSLLDVYYKGDKIANLVLPEVSVKPGADNEMLIQDQEVNIVNPELFQQFTSALLFSDQEWNLKGLVDVTAYGITFTNRVFDKTIVVTGFGGLDNTTILSFNITGDHKRKNTYSGMPQIGGVDVHINIILYNPSMVSMEMGDLFLDMFFEDQYLGYLIGTDLTLRPGANPITLFGVSSALNETFGNVALREEKMGKFFSNYMNGITSVFNVRGNAHPNSGQPSWISSVVKLVNITSPVLGKTMSIINTIQLDDISLILPGEPGADTDSGIITLSNHICAGFTLPFPITTNIYALSVELSLLKNDCSSSDSDDDDDCIFATSMHASDYLNTIQVGQTLNFTMLNHSMTVANRDLFEEFSVALLQTTGVALLVSGVSTTKVMTAGGNITLYPVGITRLPIVMQGFDNFNDVPVEVLSPNTGITAGYSWGLVMEINMVVYNPSSLGIWIAGMGLDMYYKGTKMGNVTIHDVGGKNVNLVRGYNKLQGSALYVRPDNIPLEAEFMSLYLNGNSSHFDLVGNSYAVPLMKKAMQTMHTSTYFPGIPFNLLKLVETYVKITAFAAESFLHLQNPFQVQYKIWAMTSVNIYDPTNKHLCKLKDTTYHPPFEVTPGQVNRTNGIKVVPDNYLEMAKYLIGNWTLIADSMMEFTMGDCGPISIEFRREFLLHGEAVHI